MSELKFAVVLGYFDGVHKGHREVFRAAADSGLPVCVATFSQNTRDGNEPMSREEFPARYTNQDGAGVTSDVTLAKRGGNIFTDEKKLSVFRELSAERVYMPPFDDIKNMTAAEFFTSVIMEELSAGSVVCGQDYRFGKDREGDCKLLAELCRKYGVEFTAVPPLCDEAGSISSTRIKKLLKEGCIREANELLGSCYSFTITVSEGRKLGRQLGVPTINGAFGSSLAPVRTGVYASKVLLDKWYGAVTNIGHKPTIDDGLPLAVETHIIGWSGELYGKTVDIFLTEYIREERKFGSLEELKRQIELDKNSICAPLSETNIHALAVE